jgi:hypothetical protein
VGPTSEFFANLTTALAEAVSARAECGARSLVELPPQLWIERKRLAPDWQAVLGKYKARIAPFISNQTIVGIFMGDELVCGGMNVSNFTTVTAALRQEFGKSLILYTNECTGGIERMTADDLAHLDLFSIDVYDNRNADGLAEVHAAQQTFQTSIFPKLTAKQKVLLVPGTFGNTPEGCEAANLSCPLAAQQEQIVQKLEAYFSWAKSDARVVGFNPWHFDYRVGDQAQASDDMKLGAVQMPLVLAKLKEIGRFITTGPANPWRNNGQ